MKTRKLPPGVLQALQRRAKFLIDKIYRYLPCVVCLSFGKRNTRTIPCHLLRKSTYAAYRYTIMNNLPICDEHHTKGTEISSHAWGGDTSVVKNFDVWLEKTLPKHFAWLEDHRNNRAPHRLRIGDLEEIRADLQYYADHPAAAEEVIYEKP